MEESLRQLHIQSIRAKLELCRIIGASLMESLQSSALTINERQAGYRCWAAVTRDGDVLELMLELIRRRERESWLNHEA